MIETAVVGTLTLLAIIYFGHSKMEYIGWLAVLATFGHASIADRMAEKQAALATPTVECYRWSLGYYITKEACWFVYFIAFHSYAALCGCVVFLLYPIWRKFYRRHHGQCSVD
jgi:hypothetical protein